MTIDLDAYLARVEYTGSRSPTLSTLRAVHLAHATNIVFENLDIQLGLPIRLDLRSLQTKMVALRRGGYCFEHNTLFAAVLEALGFPVTRLLARVRLSPGIAPRTHMLLRVEVDGESHLADVGFGRGGLLEPVRLAVQEDIPQHAFRFALAEEAGQWVLRGLQNDTFIDLYAFTLEPQYAVDFEVASHFTATHPESRFVTNLTAQRNGTRVRVMLRNGELVEDGPQGRTIHRIETRAELAAILDERFGLHLPLDATLRSTLVP